MGRLPINVMDCRTFEEQISEYLDGVLAKQEAAPFRAHLLQCRACRALLDDVKCAVSEFKIDDGIEPSPLLESSLCTIASAHAPFDCAAFEALIEKLALTDQDMFEQDGESYPRREAIARVQEAARALTDAHRRSSHS